MNEWHKCVNLVYIFNVNATKDLYPENIKNMIENKNKRNLAQWHMCVLPET